MNKSVFCFTVLFLFIVSGFGMTVVNQDKPVSGRWDFQSKLEWQIDQLGGYVLVDVADIKVDNTGNIYLVDRKNKKFFCLNPEGKLLYSFGKQGEGPGELKWFGRFDLTQKYLVVAGMNKFNFFNKDGSFSRSVNIGTFIYAKVVIDFNRIIILKELPFRQKGDINTIQLLELTTKTKKDLKTIKLMEGVLNYAEGDTRIVLSARGIMPEVIFAKGDEAIFYGFNDQYQITKLDLNGHDLLTFSIEGRKKKIIRKEDKKKLLPRSANDPGMPADLAKQMLKQIPDESPYFSRIWQDHQGLIYVFLIDNQKDQEQQIDIFSPQGKYLYQACLSLPDGNSYIKSSPPAFSKDAVYVFIEDAEGERLLVKFRIALPLAD